MNEIDNQIIKAAEASGCDVVVDDNSILIKSLDGMLVALPIGSESLAKSLKSLSSFGIYLQKWVEYTQALKAKKPVEAPAVELPLAKEYSLKATSDKMTWFDVVDADGNIQNEKRLRKAEAAELMAEMTNG